MTIAQMFEQPEYAWVRSQVEAVLWWGSTTPAPRPKPLGVAPGLMQAPGVPPVTAYASEAYRRYIADAEQAEKATKKKKADAARKALEDVNREHELMRATNMVTALKNKTPLSVEDYNQLRAQASNRQGGSMLPYVKQTYPMMLYKTQGTKTTSALVMNAPDHKKLLDQGWKEAP